jgi:hypothetical protein
MIGLFFLIVLMLLLLFSYYLNNDLFSPAKFYLFFLILFFFKIFISDYIVEIYLAYSFYIFLGVVLILFEFHYLSKFKKSSDFFFNMNKPILMNPAATFGTILILSLIPIATQLYMISYFGGIENYIISMVFRVEDWQGLNAILILKDIFPVLNLFFFLVLILLKFPNKKMWIFIFFLHLLIAILLGLLTGSRSWVLNIFLTSIMAINYIRSSIKPFQLLLPLIFFLIGTEVLSTFRNTADKLFDERAVQNEEQSIIIQISESATFDYGLNPLQYVYEKEYTDLKYGGTYFTILSNFIPRKIWPEKPESAGTVLTKWSEGTSYTGWSAKSPGLIAEAIMNFGYYLAYPFVFFIFILISFFVSSCYQFFYHNMMKISNQFNFNTYKKIWWGIILVLNCNQILGALTMAESTNVFFNLIKNLLFSLFVLEILFKVIKISIYKS